MKISIVVEKLAEGTDSKTPLMGAVSDGDKEGRGADGEVFDEGCVVVGPVSLGASTVADALADGINSEIIVGEEVVALLNRVAVLKAAG